MGRKPNYASSIYLGADGYWHGWVTVGVKDNGTPDRRHRKAKTEGEVTRKVRRLEKDRDDGKIRKAGQRWTVETWLTHWIENIAVFPSISERAHEGYRTDVMKHLIPGVGAHKLDKLQPEHLEALYRRLQTEKQLSAGTVHHVHRTIKNALNVAVKRGHLVQNPAVSATPPSVEDFDVDPYTVDEVRRILDEAGKGRNSARWAVALALGLRQGEVLGLKWNHVDLAEGTLRVRRSRQRPRYDHGCGDTCGKKAGWCPQRVRRNSETKGTKSKAGRRIVGIPPELVDLLKKHREEQAAERAGAGGLWDDEGWVFATETGRAINPSTDYHAWKRLLRAAGVRDARLHDGRHTAATVLLILGVPERTVMEIMGWASTAMAKRYQHVTDAVR